MVEPTKEQIKIIDFINSIKPFNWYFVTPLDKINWDEVLCTTSNNKSIIIDLIFSENHNSTKSPELGNVFGPVRVMDNIAVAQLRLYPHLKGENLQATVFHCFAHILVRERKIFKTKIVKVKNLKRIAKQQNLQIGHGPFFQWTLRKLLNSSISILGKDLSKETKFAVRSELKKLELNNPKNKKTKK